MSPKCPANLAAAFAVAAGLATAPATAGTGDLDPSFGDHGRQASLGGIGGQILYVEALESGQVLVAGGDFDTTVDEYCIRRFQGSSFMGRLAEDGGMSPPEVASVSGVAAYAMARQPDGGLVGLARKLSPDGCRGSPPWEDVVFRLASDGRLDTAFGVNGNAELPDGVRPTALVADPDGHIVIAAVRSVGSTHQLIVQRFQPGGSLDVSFGSGGSYAGPDESRWSDMHLVRTASGAYRVAVQSYGPSGQCRIIGITPAGRLDGSFGSNGVVALAGPEGAKLDCDGLTATPGGGLLVLGHSDRKGVLVRLRANGARDSTFVADPVIASGMNVVTSATIAPDGNLFVAGSGARGASIVRLLHSGARDVTFGDEGRTWIDLDSDWVTRPIVRSIAIGMNGSVIAAGGALYSDQAFVVRLLGDGSATSNGIVGFSKWHANPLPGGKAVLRLRRSGGDDGVVSIGYRTVADRDAEENEDFVPKSGRVRWDEGDRAEKAIVIDMTQGSTAPEAFESFHVELDDARGDPGTGLRRATVDIQPDGAPGGQFQLDAVLGDAFEIRGKYQVYLHRNYFASGRVCVTLRAFAGTATPGADYSINPAVHCWDDQDNNARLVDIQLVNDSLKEGDETIIMGLVNPTGGAIVGPFGRAQVTLRDDD